MEWIANYFTVTAAKPQVKDNVTRAPIVKAWQGARVETRFVHIAEYERSTKSRAPQRKTCRTNRASIFGAETDRAGAPFRGHSAGLALAPEIPAGKQRLHICAGNSLKRLRSGESVLRARHRSSDQDRCACKISHYDRTELGRWRRRSRGRRARRCDGWRPRRIGRRPE